MFHCGRCKRHLPPEAFSPSARKNGAWCRECTAAYYRRDFDRTPRVCESPLCENVFTPKRPAHIFCSARCKQRGLYHRRTAVVRAGRVCAICGAPIDHMRLDAKWCSDACFRRRPARVAVARRARLKKYGLTPEQMAAMLAAQGEACAICESGDPGQRGWATDHDHATGAVRGILCGACNLGLGKFGDDPERLRRAAEYLDAHAVGGGTP
jgi:hypothetical protein